MNPRPARTRRLYLTVGQRTMGRSLSAGRGATAAAFARRASRLRCLRPGYRNQLVSTEQDLSFFLPKQDRKPDCVHSYKFSIRSSWGEGGVSISYLVEVHADTGLPVLAEVCISKKSQSVDRFPSQIDKNSLRVSLTLVEDLIVVLLYNRTNQSASCPSHTHRRAA